MRGLFHLHDPSVHAQKKQFEWGEHLGSGTFGEVSRCYWKGHDPAIDIAMKVVPKRLVNSPSAQIHIMDLLRDLHHPHIINLADWFESREHYYIVFELATGGELFEQLMLDQRYEERHVQIMIRDIVDAISFCHERNLVHRDLKPENFLIRSKSEPPFDVIVADFGISHELTRSDEQMRTVAGSPGYTSPQVYMLKGYGKEVDIWSIGVITFVLLAGRFPFKYLEGPNFVAEASVDDIVFPDKPWKGISDAAKDFVRHCLRFEPHERLTAPECLGHGWLKSAPLNPNAKVPKPIMPSHPLPPHKIRCLFHRHKSSRPNTPTPSHDVVTLPLQTLPLSPTSTDRVSIPQPQVSHPLTGSTLAPSPRTDTPTPSSHDIVTSPPQSIPLSPTSTDHASISQSLTASKRPPSPPATESTLSCTNSQNSLQGSKLEKQETKCGGEGIKCI